MGGRSVNLGGGARVTEKIIPQYLQPYFLFPANPIGYENEVWEIIYLFSSIWNFDAVGISFFKFT